MNYILTLVNRIGYGNKPLLVRGKFYKIGETLTQRDAAIMVAAGQAIVVPAAGEPWKISTGIMQELLGFAGINLLEAGHEVSHH